jgi:hypothetical protein
MNSMSMGGIAVETSDRPKIPRKPAALLDGPSHAAESVDDRSVASPATSLGAMSKASSPCVPAAAPELQGSSWSLPGLNLTRLRGRGGRISRVAAPVFGGNDAAVQYINGEAGDEALVPADAGEEHGDERVGQDGLDGTEFGGEGFGGSEGDENGHEAADAETYM